MKTVSCTFIWSLCYLESHWAEERAVEFPDEDWVCWTPAAPSEQGRGAGRPEPCPAYEAPGSARGPSHPGSSGWSYAGERSPGWWCGSDTSPCLQRPEACSVPMVPAQSPGLRVMALLLLTEGETGGFLRAQLWSAALASQLGPTQGSDIHGVEDPGYFQIGYLYLSKTSSQHTKGGKVLLLS